MGSRGYAVLVDEAAEGEILRERGHASTLPYAGRLIGRMGVHTGSHEYRVAAAVTTVVVVVVVEQ